MRSAPNHTSEYLDEFFEADELELPRGVRQPREGSMPARNANSEIRGRHRSKAFSRRVSNRPDGMHRRRIRKMD